MSTEPLQCELFLVKTIQDKLTELLAWSPCLTEKKQLILTKSIDLLRTRSEEMIIFIQVMLKVKQELAYARLDLERSMNLKLDVNVEKRRVDWLTERSTKLSKLCHNYFHELQKELSSKASTIGDGSVRFQTTPLTCKCGLMQAFVEENDIDLKGGVKKILSSSSDVRVRQEDSVQKIFKSQYSFTSSHEAIDRVLSPCPLSIASHYGAVKAKKAPYDISDLDMKKDKKSNLESLINYQNQALDKLLVNLQNIYVDDPNNPNSKNKDDAPNQPELDSNKGDTESMDPNYGADVIDKVSEVGSIPFMMISSKDNDSEPKKVIYPRSASVWCDTSLLPYPPPVDYIKLVSKTAAKEVPRVAEKSAPIANEKGIIIKRAVNRVKAITKLKIVRQMSDSEIMKKRRIESLISEAGIQSSNKNIAVDAAKALAGLKCKEDEVINNLQSVVDKDKRKFVKYECAKTLVLLGNWYDTAMDILTRHLKYGNKKIKEDILLTLKRSPDAHFVSKSSPSLISLSSALRDILENEDETLSFNASLSLGYLCINEEKAKLILLSRLDDESFAIKQEALIVLVKQMNCSSDAVIEALLLQLSSANCWKQRMRAIELLRDIGLKRWIAYDYKKIFSVFEMILWNHSNKTLRLKVIAVLTELGLKKEACANILKRLDDKDEGVRADAIIALTIMEMKGDKELKMLLDMFELDGSMNVRMEVIKAFVELKWNHPRVMRALEDRQKNDDILAKLELTKVVTRSLLEKPKEAAKALITLKSFS